MIEFHNWLRISVLVLVWDILICEDNDIDSVGLWVCEYEVVDVYVRCEIFYWGEPTTNI